MTKFLASVTSVEEARIAFECGADLIDCKDPSSGALGALRDETVAAIVKYVAGRRPVSATIGDLPMEPSLICAAVKAKVKTGVDYVKIGMFYSSHRRSLSRHALSREPVSSGPISLDSGVHRNDGLT
ncbi:MAG: (5-formylfuran-3-yl)methyl phosphate synthase, partial [Burkholderiales bacterium]